MKTNISSSKTTQFFSFAILLLSFAALFLTSCEKESIQPEVSVETPTEVPVDEPVETNNRPDEKNDLVAFLHPLHQALFVTQEYVEIALTELNAQPSSMGGYELKWQNPSGQEMYINFFVEVVEPEVIYDVSTDVDPKNPDLIQEFEAHGTSFRMYKNAQCGPLEDAFNSPCEPNDDGTSTQRNWYASGNCIRGNGLCSEILAVGGKQVTFLNNNCQGPIQNEDKLYVWTCR